MENKQSNRAFIKNPYESREKCIRPKMQSKFKMQ